MDDSGFFITGSNGQLGTALRKQYPNARFADTRELDITNADAVANFDWSGIEVVLNAAAFTDVDGAETAKGREVSWKVNASAAAALVNVCSKHNITLVHISSDYVFDGATQPHLEDEPFTPLNVYGQSKAAGDIAVSLLPKHYILRTTWVIGEGKNFVRTMLNLAERGISPTVVHDQVGRLTFTSELVRAIDHLLKNHAIHGTYNVTNSGTVASWADIAREVFNISGHHDLIVTNITTAKYFAGKENVAPRPLGSDMSLDKLHATNFTSHSWHDDLRDYIAKVQARST